MCGGTRLYGVPTLAGYVDDSGQATGLCAMGSVVRVEGANRVSVQTRPDPELP